jgi:5-methyltetrahydropteroyltriglutamate--homocysteine methyltransferase
MAPVNPFDLIECVVKKVMVGAIDVATNAIETPTEVAATLQAHLIC